MTHLLNIDEAVDRKFLVTKNMKGQAETGTIIHVMDAENNSGGSVNVTYRVARFNEKFHDYQDYTAKFDSLAAFCKWAQPDNFIARNYEMLSIRDIQHYIKIKQRNFPSYHSHSCCYHLGTSLHRSWCWNPYDNYWSSSYLCCCSRNPCCFQEAKEKGKSPLVSED